MTRVTDEILKELGFVEKGNKWEHPKGTFIYKDKVPEFLAPLVNTMTGTAFKKGRASNES